MQKASESAFCAVRGTKSFPLRRGEWSLLWQFTAIYKDTRIYSTFICIYIQNTKEVELLESVRHQKELKHYISADIIDIQADW